MQSFARMLATVSGQRHLTIAPAISTLLILAVPLCPGIVLGVLTWVYWDGVLAGSFLFLGALAIWLSVATIGVEVKDGFVSKRQFFHCRWSIEVSNVSIRDGLAGDIPVIPAMLFSDRRTGRVIGSILKVQFHARDIQALKDALHS